MAQKEQNSPSLTERADAGLSFYELNLGGYDSKKQNQNFPVMSLFGRDFWGSLVKHRLGPQPPRQALAAGLGGAAQLSDVSETYDLVAARRDRAALKFRTIFALIGLESPAGAPQFPGRM
jgi:hypothetical protein